MRKLSAIIVVMLLSVAFAKAQDYRFGKVKEADFESTYEEGEDIPVAEVLYRNEEVSWDYSPNSGFTQRRLVHERIKINGEEGLDYATKKVRLYNESGSSRESLSKLKGYTYTLEDGKVEDEKLRNDDEFEEEVNEYWKRKSFTMPNARVGSIIEYTYQVTSPFVSIDDVILQYDIPIKRSEIRVVMLEYYIYNVQFNPRASYVPEIERGIEENNVRAELNSRQIEMSNQVITLNTNNIPALKEEPFMGDVNNYRAKISIELAGNKFPNQPVERLSTSWESVAKSIYESDNFGGQLKRTRFFEEDLDKVLAGAESPLDKTAAILGFVQNKVRWNGYYGTQARNGVKDAYKDGSGNVADINLLLVSMLRYAGLNANPVLVSSRNNGTPLFPTRQGFDYVVAHVDIDGRYLLLDGTDENTGLTSLPLRAINFEGRLVMDDGSSRFISLTTDDPSSEMTIANVNLNEDLSVTGTSQKRFTDFRAYQFRSRYKDRVAEDINRYLVDDTPGLEIENVDLTDMDNPDRPVGVKYEMNMSSAAESIGDKIYLTPLLNEATMENPFKLEERQFPIDFVYPSSSKTIVNITIPDGYTVESLPESVQMVYGDNVGSYKYVISQNGQRLTIMSDYTMNSSTVIPLNYTDWKRFFTSIVDKDAEKIVLKKA